MKTLMKISALVVLGMALSAPLLFADTGEKTIEKARATVTNAAPDDWEARAKAAHMCIKKNVNLTEAKGWLDTSLSIKESALGLEVAGDYYMVNKLYDKAIANYVKSMLTLKEKDFYANTDDLQIKIDKAKKLLKA
ncbi:hypothetical protein C900_00780 [Fulvivirga imtechensis AK7]|uniref:Uncharacterized protein n=1 Tax=Fulvivirga imtechensis AK7 TaxID=1237149 RepID=L8JYV5_9BACT|nr:hypothetical protein [Fulvivirga imtechensis]ELR72819.1 hypothetical protein C900_00780 [Fulvivirga imtechensis AK7]